MGLPPVGGPGAPEPAEPGGGKDAGGGKGDAISQEEYDAMLPGEKAKYIEDPDNPGKYIPNPTV